jgi:cell division protein FtsB
MTGYNYNILRGCSEAAIKSVKKYTAAMVIVCILWFFIGFTFAQRYLASHVAGCVMAGIISVVIIVQVEKQIILSINPGWRLFAFRICLAFMMSLLGAVIIDQILLKKDIELEKISYITERVNKILPVKTAELEKQIAALDTTINNKEAEKQRYIEESGRQPTIMIVASQTQQTLVPQKVVGASGRDSTVYKSVPLSTISRNPIPNPKIALIAPLDSTIGALRQQKANKENDLLHIRPALEKEMQEKTGFLDELKVMKQLILGSNVALVFWLLWICFFLFIEMLVLFSKMGDKKNDYEKTVLHHMHLQIWRLDALSKELRPGMQGN